MKLGQHDNGNALKMQFWLEIASANNKIKEFSGKVFNYFEMSKSVRFVIWL